MSLICSLLLKLERKLFEYLEMSSSCLHSLSEKGRNPIFGSRGVCLFAPQDKGDETETVTCGFNFFNF